MARKKKTPKIPHRSRHASSVLVVIVLLIVAALCGLMALDKAGVIYVSFFHQNKPSHVVTEGTVEIHMIDVGQGDSILIMAPSGNVLIDAGDEDAEDDLKRYLDDQGIEEIEYLLLTHPDADHIGSADMVVNTYSVGHVIMEPYTYATETKVYKNLEDAITTRSVTTIDPSPNDIYSVGELEITILGPLDTYTDKNNNSIVARVDYGDTSLLMTGDASKKSESALVAQYASSGKLRCDVLKVGHHGSDSSTSESFLAAVKPTVAIISCGKNNKYGHPKAEILERLEENNVTVYRTDLVGSIVLITDGVNITYQPPEVVG